MSRSIGNDARVNKVFIAPELGTKGEPTETIRIGERDQSEKWNITSLPPLNNLQIKDAEVDTTRLEIDKTTGNLDTNGGDLTVHTLNYTNLNPPVGGAGGTAPRETSSLVGIGAGSEFTIATIALPKADVIASALFTLQSITPAFKQTLTFHAGAIYRFTSGTLDSSITIHQNLIESDTPPFTDIRIREDASGALYLLATASVGIDVDMYMDLKTTKWVLSGAISVPPAGTDLTLLQTNANKVISTDNVRKPQALQTNDVTTNSLSTDILDDNLSGVITVTAPRTDFSANDIDNVAQLTATQTNTDIFSSRTGVDVSVLDNLSFSGGRELRNLNVITQDAGVNLQLTEGLSVQSDIVMNDNAITGLTNLTSGTAPNITVSGNFDLQTNNITSVGTLNVDDIFATTGTQFNVHDTLNMTNNHIHNLADPVQPKDGANKDYVDGLAAGYVTNPMTTNLDAGSFNITNITNLSATGVVGFTGTTTISNSLLIPANTDYTNTRVEHIDGASQVWMYADSANNTQNFTDGRGKLTLPSWVKGVGSFLLGSIFSQVHTAVDHLMYYGRQAGSGIQIEKVIAPSHTQLLACKDCNDFAEGGVIPNGGATIWDNTNNGQEVTLKCWDVARQIGNPYGTGLTGQVHTPYAGQITGFFIKNGGALWNYTGGATITIKIGGLAVFTGTPLNVPPFFSFAMPENLWITVVAGGLFPDMDLEINTPNPGDTIDNFGSNPLEATFTFIQDITN